MNNKPHWTWERRELLRLLMVLPEDLIRAALRDAKANGRLGDVKP